MIYKKIKKSFVNLSLDINNELNDFSQGVNNLYNGYLYTFFHKYENKISIGFIQMIDIDVKEYKENGYRLVEKRLGTKTDSDLLKKTLLELGHKDLNSNGIYPYSAELLNHLNILGWPIGEFKKYKKKYR